MNTARRLNGVKKSHLVSWLCLSAMFQDVDQASKGIADVEAHHAPWLSYRTIFDLEPCVLHPPVNVRQVVYFYREVWHRRSRPAFGRHADLWRHTAIRCKGRDPPEIH